VHPRPNPPKTKPASLVESFRPRSNQLALHPQEKWVLGLLTLHLCFLPWALGTMHLWSQCVSLVLALAGFIAAAQPRTYDPHQTSGEPARVRPLLRLWRFPLFWTGLLVLAYIAIQGLNPAWRYRSNPSYWWLDPVEHLSWLPSGMEVPFAIAGPWRALLIFASLWLTVCTAWIGLMRRLTFRLLFTFLVVNGVLLSLLGLAQQLTHATGVFWLVPVSSQSFVASFIYRNHAGAYLNILLAVGAGLAWWYYARANRRLDKSSPAGVFTFAAIIVGLMVLFTSSRGAILLLLTFVLLAGISFLWAQVRLASHERSPAVIAGLLILLVTFIGIGLFSLRVENVWKRFAGMIVDPVASAHDRTEAHAAAAEMYAAEPILGWGAGCFRFGFPNYLYKHPEIYYSGTDRRKFWEHAHNDLLEFAVEFGVVGSLLLAAPLCWLGWALVRRRFWANPLSLLAVLGCALTLVHSRMDFVFQTPAILLTWVLVLLACVRWAELDQPPAARSLR
jgi:O-antigen ligase